MNLNKIIWDIPEASPKLNLYEQMAQKFPSIQYLNSSMHRSEIYEILKESSRGPCDTVAVPFRGNLKQFRDMCRAIDEYINRGDDAKSYSYDANLASEAINILDVLEDIPHVSEMQIAVMIGFITKYVCSCGYYVY